MTLLVDSMVRASFAGRNPSGGDGDPNVRRRRCSGYGRPSRSLACASERTWNADRVVRHHGPGRSTEARRGRGNGSSRLLLVVVDELQERVGLERGAADEGAVDVGQRHQALDVVGLDAAAVEDAQRRRRRPCRASRRCASG